jgi:hypothetical protein
LRIPSITIIESPVHFNDSQKISAINEKSYNNFSYSSTLKRPNPIDQNSPLKSIGPKNKKAQNSTKGLKDSNPPLLINVKSYKPLIEKEDTSDNKKVKQNRFKSSYDRLSISNPDIYSENLQVRNIENPPSAKTLNSQIVTQKCEMESPFKTIEAGKKKSRKKSYSEQSEKFRENNNDL